MGGGLGCFDSTPLLLLPPVAGPFCLLLFDPDNVSSFGWPGLDCGFTREEGAGRGRGGISENGEEEGIGGGGKGGGGVGSSPRWEALVAWQMSSSQERRRGRRRVRSQNPNHQCCSSLCLKTIG